MRKPKQRRYYPAVKPYLSQFYRRRVSQRRRFAREAADLKLSREVRPIARDFIAAGYQMLEGKHPYEILEERLSRNNWERPRDYYNGPEIELDVLVKLSSTYLALDYNNPPRRYPNGRSYVVKLYYRFDLGGRSERWVFVRTHWPEELYSIDRDADKCDELVIAEAREQLERMTIHNSTFEVVIPRGRRLPVISRRPRPEDIIEIPPRRDIRFVRCATFEGRAGWRFDGFV